MHCFVCWLHDSHIRGSAISGLADQRTGGDRRDRPCTGTNILNPNWIKNGETARSWSRARAGHSSTLHTVAQHIVFVRNQWFNMR